MSSILPTGKQGSELYYDYLSNIFLTLKESIHLIKGYVLKDSSRDTFSSEDYQKEVITDIDSLLNKDDIEILSHYFELLQSVRASALIKHAHNKISNLTSTYPDLRVENYLSVRVILDSSSKDKNAFQCSDDEPEKPMIYSKTTPVNNYLSEADIDFFLSKYPDSYLPNEVLCKPFKILSANNLVHFFDKNTFPKYIYSFRVKSGSREKEKITDWLLNVDRYKFHYDGIAAISVVPKMKFYDEIETVKNLSKSLRPDMIGDFSVDYRPKKTNKPSKFPDIVELPKKWNKARMNKLINVGNYYFDIYKDKEYTALSDDEKKFSYKQLLAGAWIDNYAPQRMETIVLTHEFYKWFSTGMLSPDNYALNLMHDRIEKHKNYTIKHRPMPCDLIASHLDNKLSDIFKDRFSNIG